MPPSSFSRPWRLASLAGVVLVLTGVVRTRTEGGAPATPCTDEPASCVPDARGAEEPRTTVVPAAEFCVDVGYLCAGLSERSEMRVQRWSGDRGTIVVHVPLPDFEDAATARRLQRAAVQGLRAWNNQPFPVVADLRGDRNPDFTLRWRERLQGVQLGVTLSRWSPSAGLSVESIELATRDPRRPSEGIAPDNVRLTAAHEMGHALGLPHSGAERDVMYPMNTATSMSAQDYRSVEVLYRTPDGIIVRR